MSDPKDMEKPPEKPSNGVLAAKPRRGIPIPRARLELVEKLWLAGWDSRRIQVHVAKMWKCTRRNVRRDLVRVQAKLALLPKPSPEAARERAEKLLLEAFEVAKRGGRLGPQASAMATAASRIAQLDGLLSDRVEHTIKPDLDLSKLTDEELATLRALRAKAAAK